MALIKKEKKIMRWNLFSARHLQWLLPFNFMLTNMKKADVGLKDLFIIPVFWGDESEKSKFPENQTPL